jgi:hypothetical protein
MSGSRLKVGTVVLGVFVAMGCIALMAYLVGFAFGVAFGVSTGTQQEIMRRFGASDAVHWSIVLICTFGTCLGGFVAASAAGGYAIEHGALVGLAMLVSGGVLHWQGYDPGFEVPQWTLLLWAFFTLPAGAAGGFLASDSPGAFV